MQMRSKSNARKKNMANTRIKYRVNMVRVMKNNFNLFFERPDADGRPQPRPGNDQGLRHHPNVHLPGLKGSLWKTFSFLYLEASASLF